MSETRFVHDQSGAILPMVAILMVVLLGFAAFAVDLGAAWAERTLDQTAADAAALAAGVQYLHDDTPSAEETVDTVIAYVAENLTDPPTLEEWQSCVDNDKPDELYIPLTVDGDEEGIEVTYNCISLRQKAGAPSLLRVRIPDRNVPTSFAKVLGIDTITVGASAIVEISYSPATTVMPFSLPRDPASEECLGLPPNGQNSEDVAPCANEFGTSTISARFGLLDSPWFGTGDEEPHATGDTCIGGNIDGQVGGSDVNTYEERTEHNLALGLDHIIKEFPHGGEEPDVNEDMWQSGYDDGFDACNGAAIVGEDPFILNIEAGAEMSWDVVSDGLIGPGPYGVPSQPGRLRQTGGLNDGSLARTLQLAGDIRIDNVGLWEYLEDYYQNLCNVAEVVGREATENMKTCIRNARNNSDLDLDFNKDLLDSPRYAVVPVLNYNNDRTNTTGDSWHAIEGMLPVYIQSTWYGCDRSSSTHVDCLFQPEGFVDPANPDNPYSTYHNPGESDTSPCYMAKGGNPNSDDATCVSPDAGDLLLKGASVIVLEWNWLPGSAQNAIGGGPPYRVRLYR